MYKNVEKAISDMEMNSKFMPSKKSGKYNKNHMKNENICNVSPMAASPLEMGCGFKNMNMDMSMPMDVMQPCPMDMMQPMNMEMMEPMNMDMMQPMPMNMMQPMQMNMQPMPMNMAQNFPCEAPCQMPGAMMAPQMIQSMVQPCILNLYNAYPYLNPNR